MKHLLLALTLVLSSEAWAAQKCSAFLKSQVEIAPIARITFSADGKQDLSFAFSREKTNLDAEFTKKFLTGLTAFFTEKSTTTSRLEERAVMKESDSKALLDESGVKWDPRDQKNPGEDFTTITTYSGKFIMDSATDVGVSAKMRARKYYSHNIGESDTSKMKSVFGEIGSLEIKISNVAGVDADGFTAFPNSVFKPRVFISDDTLKKLSKMNHEKLSKAEVREKLIEELFFTEFEGKQMNPDLAQIGQFVDAVTTLLNENPNLFEVQTVIAYNRDSYSADVDKDTNYQYTLDRNIRIFEPDASLSADNIISYLDRTPLHKVEDGVAFAELKSPLTEKAENTPTYQRLSNALFSRHRATFSEGKGKHSLGSSVRSKIAQTSLSEQLFTEGLLFYLIKGVGNMPTPPNKNHLVQLRYWDIALPLTIGGKKHRIIFGYKPNSDDGLKEVNLKTIKIIDSFGDKVDLDNKAVDEIIATARLNPEPSTITIDNQAISFPSVIKDKMVDEFKDFFSEFYKGFDKGRAHPREIESLYSLENRAHLNKYTRRMKISNFLSWLKDRVYKLSPQLIGGAAIGIAMGMVVNNSLDTPPAPLNTNVQSFGLPEGVNIVVKGEGFEKGLFGIVLPDGKIQILAVQPTVSSLNSDVSIDVKSIEQVEINSETAESPGTILLHQE
jgi:hypothetical protein